MDSKDYLIKNNNEFSMITLQKGELNNILSSKNFENDMITHITQYEQDVIIDCSQNDYLTIDWFRSFFKINQILRKKGKGLRLIGACDKTRRGIRDEGLNNSILCSENLQEAKKELGIVVQKKLNTDFINPYLDATIKVLEIQAGVKSTARPIYLKKENDVLLGDVSGIIGLVSDAFKGTIIISFPEKTFLRIISSMLGEDITQLNKDIIDGAGELTNMIFGQAKIELNSKGYGIKMALPSVIQGKNHSLSTKETGPCVVIPFGTEVGDFFITITLDS